MAHVRASDPFRPSVFVAALSFLLVPLPLPLRHVIRPRKGVVLKGLLEDPVAPRALLGAAAALLVALLLLLQVEKERDGVRAALAVLLESDNLGARQARGSWGQRGRALRRAPVAAACPRRRGRSPCAGGRLLSSAGSCPSCSRLGEMRRRSAGLGEPAQQDNC